MATPQLSTSAAWARIAELEQELTRVLNSATREMGKDSCEQPYAHIRLASLDRGREVLNKPWGDEA